jgi:hypothetical protein
VERVTFLIEQTGERLGCLLNPETLVLRRIAGVRPRRSFDASLTGISMSDNPLLYTGGGFTDFVVDLLFDVSLAGSTIETDDVQDLTRPLWQLAENAAITSQYGRPPTIRFVWGKSMNIPAVVAAVAERFEHFSPGGAPQRSWLRMRLVRVDEPATPEATGSPLGDTPISAEDLETLDLSGIPETDIASHEIQGAGGEEPGGSTQRLDEISYRYYGTADLWRLLAAFNGIVDPLHLPPGLVIRIPPLSAFSGFSAAPAGSPPAE